VPDGAGYGTCALRRPSSLPRELVIPCTALGQV
jgi:hypothetical protein